MPPKNLSPLHPRQILLVQMVVLLHKQHIGDGQEQGRGEQIDPVRQHRRGAEVNEAKRHRQLQGHINQRHRHVAHLQLIRHQLIGVLAMRLPQILVQQDAMEDGHAAVDPIHQEEHDPRHVLRRQHQLKISTPRMATNKYDGTTKTGRPEDLPDFKHYLTALPREMGTCPSGNEPTRRRALRKRLIHASAPRTSPTSIKLSQLIQTNF